LKGFFTLNETTLSDFQLMEQLAVLSYESYLTDPEGDEDNVTILHNHCQFRATDLEVCTYMRWRACRGK